MSDYETARREAWTRFAAAVSPTYNPFVPCSIRAEDSAKCADAMLAEWEKRFGQESQEDSGHYIYCLNCKQLMPVPANAPVGVKVDCPNCGNSAIRVKMGHAVVEK